MHCTAHQLSPWNSRNVEWGCIAFTKQTNKSIINVFLVGTSVQTKATLMICIYVNLANSLNNAYLIRIGTIWGTKNHVRVPLRYTNHSNEPNKNTTHELNTTHIILLGWVDNDEWVNGEWWPIVTYDSDIAGTHTKNPIDLAHYWSNTDQNHFWISSDPQQVQSQYWHVDHIVLFFLGETVWLCDCRL
jgi:hypothetical protein